MLFQSRLNSCFIFADDLPLNYVLSAKSGCSTILSHLWHGLDQTRGVATFKGDPHEGWPWGRIWESTPEEMIAIAARPTFTVVRNPFARALSGYLSKVGERKEDDLFIWKDFSHRFWLQPDARPSFEDYLEMIEREPPEMMDVHWAPQYLNLLQPAARIDKVFYLENQQPLADFLQGYFPHELKRSRFGFRDALSRLDRFYTPQAIEGVQRIYAQDFHTFGYRTELNADGPDRPLLRISGSASGVVPLLQHMASDDWKDKLAHLEDFERENGSDYSTAMTRFSCGGPEEDRARAADLILATRPGNYLLLREIEGSYLAHGNTERAALFGDAAKVAHEAVISGRPIQG